MTASAPLTLDHCEAQVEAMLEQGMLFSDVEDVIDAAQLSTERKAALWLLAWSLRDQGSQRRDARIFLAAADANGWGVR